MGETLFGVSQSSLILRPKVAPLLCYSDCNSNSTNLSPRRSKIQIQRGLLQLGLSKKTFTSQTIAADRKFIFVRVASESKASDILTFDAATKNPANIEPDLGGGSGDGFDDRGGSGGGGGGGGGGNGGDNIRDEGGDEGESNEKSKKLMPLSMSQKLTLGYAILVGGN